MIAEQLKNNKSYADSYKIYHTILLYQNQLILIQSEILKSTFIKQLNNKLRNKQMGNKNLCNDVPVKTGIYQQFSITKPQSKIAQSKPVQSKHGLSEPIQRILAELKPFEDKLPKRLRRINLDNHFKYQGEVDDGKPNGYGRLFKSDGSYFVGEFHKGKIAENSQGFYIKPDGAYYIGKFVNELACDNSGHYISETYQYVGGFRDNQFNGHGKEKDTNFKFQGEFKNGRKVKGTLQWQEGNECDFRYIGRFDQKQNFQDANGTLQEPTGIYNGQFKNGKKNGNGEYQFKSKLKYVGTYVNNVKQGEGIVYNCDNLKAYEGEWKNGLPDGKGISYKGQQKIESQFHQGIDIRFMESQHHEQHAEHNDGGNNEIIYDK